MKGGKIMTEKTKSLQAKEKRGPISAAEQMNQGPKFTPEVDIFETDGEIVVVADMPGVKAENLDIDLRENTLTLAGKALPPEGPDEVDTLREYQTGSYFRQFTLSEMIDQPEIDAKITDGVLKLTLPKVKPVTPRKIKVKAV
jgi:HSP20 family molecular chaperone IbpA